MTREEAINKARQLSMPEDLREILEALAPDLRESEDEKIRKVFEDFIENYLFWGKDGISKEKARAWLEKQKIFSEKGEGVYGYKDGKICFLGQWLNNSMYMCDAPIGRDADGNLIYVEDLEDEKQKAPHYTKRNALFDKCVENCDPAIMKEVSDNVDKMLEKGAEVRKWGEEDEKMLTWLCRIVHSQRVTKVITLKEESELGEWIDKWLNHNPQPRWKPNKEQIEALKDTIFFDDFFDKTVFRKKKLVSLLEALEKLM